MTNQNLRVMLLDPSTPDKMSLTLANGDIIRPFVHDVKREQMYAGGGGGLLYHAGPYGVDSHVM